MESKLLSLCMIVRNEEKVLERCLKSVKEFVDEIIIVDTGSTDKTKQIAQKFTDKIYDFEWIDDFSAARNYAFDKAEGSYIMWLDADDVITPSDLQKLMVLKGEMTGQVDVYMLKYDIAFDNVGRATFSYYRERILKNDKTFRWEGVVHEIIAPHGKIEYVDISIQHKKNKQHDKNRNLNIYRKLIRAGRKLNTREQYYYSRELYYHNYFRKCISELKKVLQKQDMWIEDRLGAIELMGICYMNLKEYEKSRVELFKSFNISSPRAKILCLIGDSYIAQTKYDLAIFWLKSALKLEKIKQGFIEEDYYGYYPAINLCVCYYYIGNLNESMRFNEMALKFKPNDEIALYNRDFLSKTEKISY